MISVLAQFESSAYVMLNNIAGAYFNPKLKGLLND